jgi:hypothetical protein
VRVVDGDQGHPGRHDHHRRGQHRHRPPPHYGQPHHRRAQEDRGGRVTAARRGEGVGGDQVEPEHADQEQADGPRSTPGVYRQRGDDEQDQQVEDRAFQPAVLHDRAGEQPPVLVVVLDLVRLPGQRRVDAVPAELDQRRHRDHGHHGQCRRARSPQPLPQITEQLHSAHDRHGQHHPVADREDRSGARRVHDAAPSLHSALLYL